MRDFPKFLIGLAAGIVLGLFFAGCSEAAAATTQTAQFNVSWQDNSGSNPAVADQEDGFTIERALGQTGTFSVIGTVGQNVTTFTDVIANDPGATTYCYRVQAFNKSGKSAYSNVACGTTPTIQVAPGTPGNVNVTVSVTVTVTP